MSRFQITTSWDDGYPLDARLADMLRARGIRATFYIPRSSERAVMDAAAMRRLSEDFEIGAHTLTHCDLTRARPEAVRAEMAGSKDWVEQMTGKSCKMFCFPRGKFRPVHVREAWEAGYVGCRTVELLSIRPPENPPLLATSVQAFPHSLTSYGKNLAKRGRWSRLRRLMALPAAGNWVGVAGSLLEEAAREGGTFHLWGHSWEFTSEDHWKLLGAALDRLQTYRDAPGFFTNAEVCAAAGNGARVLAEDFGKRG